VTSVNAALTEFMHVQASDLVGRSIASIFVTESAQIYAAISDAMGIEFKLEALPGKSSKLQLIPALDKNGDVSGWIVMLRPLEALGDDSVNPADSFDPLTNLPGRRLITSRLEHLLDVSNSEQEQITILCVDLDGFGRINKEFGLAVGDNIFCWKCRVGWTAVCGHQISLGDFRKICLLLLYRICEATSKLMPWPRA